MLSALLVEKVYNFFNSILYEVTCCKDVFNVFATRCKSA